MFVSPFVNPLQVSDPFRRNSLPTTVNKEQILNNVKRHLTFAAGNDGCYLYRRGFFSNHATMTGLIDTTTLTKMILDHRWYEGFTSITLQRQASNNQKNFVQFLAEVRKEFGFKLIYEVDDVVFREDIPDYNSSKKEFDTDEIRQNCIDMINMCDEVTVTCKFMRDLYIEKTGKKEITVVPNFMPYWWIGHQYNNRRIIDSYDKNKKKPRIVYAGSGAHFDLRNLNGQQDDFSHVLKFFVDNRHKYQFVFIGAYPPPLHPYVVSREIEVHPWKDLLAYPTFLSSLNAQLFIAPLQDNNFNRAKSDIKFFEAAQLGIPCLVQNMVTYASAPDSMKFTTREELETKVEELLNWKNRSRYYKMIPELRKLGETRFLELPHNIGCMVEALETPWNSSERRFLRPWN